MKKLLVAVCITALSISASSPIAAKAPKGCKRTNVRPANPRGSVLVQPATRAAAAPAVPVVVFGGPQAAGAASGISTAGGTVVPSITSQAAPQAAAPRSGKKRARRRTSAVIDLPSSPDAGALAAASSC